MRMKLSLIGNDIAIVDPYRSMMDLRLVPSLLYIAVILEFEMLTARVAMH